LKVQQSKNNNLIFSLEIKKHRSIKESMLTMKESMLTSRKVL